MSPLPSMSTRRLDVLVYRSIFQNFSYVNTLILRRSLQDRRSKNCENTVKPSECTESTSKPPA